MQKGYLRRPLATLLSLLMVIGMFTVCGFGALADGDVTDIKVKAWSVDDLDAAAQATGTKNVFDKAIYHKTDYVVGAQRDDNTAGGNWLFHSQGLTNDNHFKKGDTLRVSAYFKGELRTANAWGYFEVSYDNKNELTSKTVLTPDVIDQMTDVGVDGIKKLTWDIELDQDGYSENGKLLQSRVWVDGGAYLACYGVEYYNLTTNRALWGMDPAKGKEGGNASTLITRPALRSYCTHPATRGDSGENWQYTAQNYEGDFDDAKNGDINEVLFNNLSAGQLAAGNYVMNFDLTTKYALGEKKFTFNVYSGGEQIYTKTVMQTADWIAQQWSPDSGIVRLLSIPFTVDEQAAGKEITFEIVCHNQTHFTLFGMELHQLVSVGDALAQWSYKDLLAASDRGQMGVSSYSEEGKKVIGTEMYEGDGLWACENIVTPEEITLQKGHTLRLVHKLYSVNGNVDGSPYFRIKLASNINVNVVDQGAPWGSYSTDATKYDSVYGYAYKELAYEFTAPDDFFEGADSRTAQLMNWLMVAGHDYAKGPIRWYASSLYDVTDGNKLLYTIDGEAINDSHAGGNTQRRTVYGYEHQAEVPVGYRAIGPDPNGQQCWSRFNVMSSVGDTPVEPGDELEAVVDIWVDNGYDATKLKYSFELFSGEGKQIDSGLRLSDEDYNAIPTQFHPEYGYAYKRTVCNYTVTEETGARINQHGIYPLIGTDAVANMKYDEHPLSIYRYYVYNKTKNVYYVNLPGSELMSMGGSGTVNEVIWGTKGDIAYANGGFVRAGQDVAFDALTASAGMAGKYALNFAVAGDEGAEYTLTAYAKNGATLTPIASKSFQAAGGEEMVELAFNVREGLVGKPLTFGIATKTGELGVKTISLQYAGELEISTVHTWSVSDIAGASLDENMTYEFTNRVTIGANVKNGPWEIFANGYHWTGPIAGVNKNDVLRMEVDLGTEESVTNMDGQMATMYLCNDHDNLNYVSDKTTYSGAQYNELEEKTNAEYGYTYRTLTAKVTVPDNDALVNAITTGGGFDFRMDTCQIAENGRKVYRAAIVNETTGKTIYEVSGAQIRPLLFPTAQSTDITVIDGYKEEIYGLEVNGDTNFPGSNGLWATMNIPVYGITMEAGHTIRFVQKMYVVDDYFTGAGPFFRVYNGPTKIADESIGWDIYKDAEEQIDSAYDYIYKEIPYEVEITDEMACANAKIEHWLTVPGANYNESVIQFYQFEAYDVTNGDEALLYTLDGAAIAKANKSDNIVSHPLSFVEMDPEKASAVVFSADAAGAVTKPLSVTLADLGMGAGVYEMAAKNAENVTANAIITLGEDAYTIGAGEFVITEDLLNAPIGFVLNKEAGAVAKIGGVDLVKVRDLAEGDTQNYQEELNKLNQAAADAVIAKIAALPETVALTDEEAIVDARAALDALTAAQKALVNNQAKLEKAETDLAALKGDKDAADAVIAKIAALPAVDSITLANAEAVDEADTAYKALSDAAKNMVDAASTEKLTGAVAKIAQLRDDKAAAEAVEAKINALPDSVTAANKAAVDEAAAAYEALTDAQKALVSEAAKAKLDAAVKALEGKLGDVNNDGKIDAADALLALQHSVKLITLNDVQFRIANVNGDDKVDAADALLILQCSVELIKAEDFPAANK